MKPNNLIVIVGPTAIGKTALSLQLAQYFNCQIISCDSRQFFKEMTIGTAVPSKTELAQAKHHFIQNISVLDTYTVGDFEREALMLLPELFMQNNTQIMVGGSGLYVDAVINGFDYFPDIIAEVRDLVRDNYNNLGLHYLQDKLQELDVFYYNQLKNNNPQTLQNPQRLMRFVEVCISTGKPYSSFLNQEKNKRNFNVILIGLQADRNIMYQRINQRVDIMLNQGLLAEAQALYNYKYLNALQTVGYRELFDYLDQKTTIEFAIEEIKKNTRRFAKRQLTWFKRNQATIWFDYKTSADSVITTILPLLNL